MQHLTSNGHVCVRRFGFWALAVALASSAQLAKAQPGSAKATVQGTQAGANETEIGEILVTARKRSESASSVPESLVVLNSDLIASKGITQAGDLGKTLPNVRFQQDLSVTSSFISIRGITATRNTDPAVALVIDGVQASSASQIRQQLFDIEQIEVLKGPQGALYGRNALGGAINVVTKKPTNTLEGRAEFGFGNAKSVEASASLSGPLIENRLFFRVSGYFHDDNGSIENTALHTNVDFKTNKTGRARLLWDDGGLLTADMKLNHDEFKGGGYYFVITRAKGAPYPVGNPKSNSNSFNFSPTSVPISMNYSTIDDASLNINYKLGFAKLTLISAASHTKERYGIPGEGIGSGAPGDLDFTPTEILGNSQTYNVKTWSQEARLTSDTASSFRWQLVGYYLNVNRDDTLPVYVTNGVSPLQNIPPFFPNGTKRKIKAYAVSAQIDYDLLDGLTATAALRYDHERRTQLNQDDPNPATNRDAATFDLPTPKFSIAYKPARGQLVYATAARGFRSGGFNAPRTRFSPVFKQEEVWSYELGYKGRLFDNALTVAAAAFDEDIKNKQEFVFDVGNASQTIYNIPKSSIQGVELELTYRITPQFSLNAAGGLMKSKIKSFNDGPLFPTPFTNASVIGNRLPTFSHWSSSFGFDYNTLIGGGKKLKVHADYALRGKNYWDTSNRDVEKNIGLLGANITLDDKYWGLTLWGSNLTNTKYWSTWYNQDVTGLPDVGYPAEPRRFGVKLRLNF